MFYESFYNLLYIFSEIVRVRAALFQNVEKKPLELPAPEGPQVTLMEKVFVDPQKKHQEVKYSHNKENFSTLFKTKHKFLNNSTIFIDSPKKNMLLLCKIKHLCFNQCYMLCDQIDNDSNIEI